MTSLTPRRTVLVHLLSTAAALLLLTACDRPAAAPTPPPAGGTSAPIAVVATIAMIGDVAANIGGDRVSVTNLMSEGVDPHQYKASTGDVRLMADAGMILFNGLHLEGRMADVITKMASRTTVVQVTETIDEKLLRQPPEFDGHPDPHVWFDVTLWSTAAMRICDALTAKDPAAKAAIEARASDYARLLAELHEYAKTTTATIPANNRVMVTAHDAFGYFGRAYGLEVLAIQGISTDSEASLRSINALIDTLVTRKIPAVFVESSVPRKTIDALVEGCKSRNHAVTIGGELFSDAMGKTGTFEGTYVGMVVHNVETITSALGGTVPARRPALIAAHAAQAAAPRKGTP